MERYRRIAAYGLCRDAAGRFLLVWWPRTAVWSLPGGQVGQGEPPEAAAVRAVRAETGLAVAVAGLRTVYAALWANGHLVQHTDAVVYDVRPEGGAAGQGARWFDAAEAETAPLDPYVRPVLGLPCTPPVGPAPLPAQLRALPGVPLARGEEHLRTGDSGQRFSAYALTADADGRVLLTRNAPGYPYAGRWHLPGGGTDFGEQPGRALLREITEETAQRARITALVEVGHRHTPRALGPEGRPLDWHVVRVLYRAFVDAPTPARVVEADGSTAEARWWGGAELSGLPLTPVAEAALARGG
ncbi:MAG TPA: NUDIX hydrolase [Pilimelia sp.]|nr:NUDIX hydrolase [Pilimelia sp.]